MTTTAAPERLDIDADARPLYRARVALDRAVGESALDPRLRDLVSLRASQINGCAYCVDMHTRNAVDKGETQQRLFAVAAWRESPRIATQAEPIDPAYEAAGAHFSTEELAALLYAIATINTWNRLAVPTHMVFEP